MLTEQYPNVPPAEVELATQDALHQARRLARDFREWIDGEVLENEARLAVVVAAREYDPDRASFRTFANTVTRRRLLEEWRRQHRLTRTQRRAVKANLKADLPRAAWMRPALSLNIPTHWQDDENKEERLEDTLLAPEEWPAHEARLVVGQLLTHLEPRRREVIERHYLREETFREIAARLGVSVSRVQQLKEQGFGQLQVLAGTRCRYQRSLKKAA